MLRGFRHVVFLLLQAGILLTGLLAFTIWPNSWRAISACILGGLVSSIICERIAGRYLRNTLGRLRRAADQMGRGRPAPLGLDALPGEDFHKLVAAINMLASRMAESAQEQQRLQDELRRRERLAFLGELAATVAHEVNNPLDGIQNCARILRRSLGDPRRAGQMLDLIDGGLGRIELIVRRLLTLARQHVVRPAPVELSRVADAALHMAQSKLEAAGVLVRRSYEAGDDWIAADAPLLEQALLNLFLNAADSMTGGGALGVRIRDDSASDEGTLANFVAIEVADSGEGIAPEVLPHIFEPFFTTKRGGKGTGLGLPIAARIIDAHGGTIEVAAREGGGTVFTVALPAVKVRAQPTAHLEPSLNDQSRAALPLDFENQHGNIVQRVQ